jgi:hypothetical protein
MMLLCYDIFNVASFLCEAAERPASPAATNRRIKASLADEGCAMRGRVHAVVKPLHVERLKIGWQVTFNVEICVLTHGRMPSM